MKLGNLAILAACLALTGCVAQRSAQPSRSGLEKAMVSGAIDRALDKVNLAPLQGKTVYLDAKHLDDPHRGYVIVSLHLRLLHQHTLITENLDQADVVLEVASGGIGTNRDEPEAVETGPEGGQVSRKDKNDLARADLNATAKLVVLAYDAKTKKPLIPSGTAYAKVDRTILHIFDLKEADRNPMAITEAARKAFDSTAPVVPASLQAEKKPAAARPQPAKPAVPDQLPAAVVQPVEAKPAVPATPAPPMAAPSPLSGNTGFPGYLPPAK